MNSMILIQLGYSYDTDRIQILFEMSRTIVSNLLKRTGRRPGQRRGIISLYAGWWEYALNAEGKMILEAWDLQGNMVKEVTL